MTAQASPVGASRVGGGEAEGWRGRWAGVAVLVAATIAPLLAYVGNLGFAPLLALGGLVLAPVLVGRRTLSAPYLVLAVGLAWALASVGWSVVQPHVFHRYKDVEAFTGLKLVLQLALYGAFVRAAAYAPPTMARAALLALGMGLAVVGVLLLLESFGGARLYMWIKGAAHQATRPDLARRNVARATYALALLVWPAGLVLIRRGWGWALLPTVAGLLVGAAMLNVAAPLAAAATAAAVFLALRYGGGRVAAVLTALAAVYVLAAPMIILALTSLTPPHATPGNMGKLSWAVRLDIWRFVMSLCEARPWTGWGLDASRAFPAAIPLHPHDFALQVWLELGAVGALIAAIFWMLVFGRVATLVELDRNLGAAAGASAVAYLVIGAVSFGAWQEWWLALGALAAASVALAQSAGKLPARDAPPVSQRRRSGV